MRSVLVLTVAALAESKDVGLEGLFRTVKNMTDDCHPATIPPGIDGKYVIAGPGVFEMGKYKFSSTADGFAQMYKFVIGDGQICLSSKTMLTKFWNQSVEMGEIAPNLLFAETIPPRPTCPALDLACDLRGGNDNTDIATMKVGEATVELTDSYQGWDVDWDALKVTGLHEFVDPYVQNVHHLSTGSAHPVRVPGGYVAMVAEMALLPGAKPKVDFVRVFDADNGKTRKLICRMTVDAGYYAHSFGISENRAVMPLNVEMKVEVSKLIHRSDMKDKFVAHWKGLAVLDLNGKEEQEPTMYQVEPFWHTHVANTYEDEAGSVVMDVVTFKSNMFDGPMVILSELFQKEVRDNNPNRGVLKRYILTKNGTAHEEFLTRETRHFDFIKINPKYTTKKHCFIYGIEYWHDDKTAFDQAVGKLDVCSGSKSMTYWRRENWYPSEPIFVGREGATAEDDGHLMFAALNGETQNSHFIIVRASDMKEVSNTEFQGRLAFTIHADFIKNAATPIVV